MCDSVEFPAPAWAQPAAPGCFDCVVACAPTPLNMTGGKYAFCTTGSIRVDVIVV